MGFCIPSLSSFLCIHSAVDHDSEAVIAILDWLASFCSSLGSVRAIGHGLKNMDFPIDKTADGRRGFFWQIPSLTKSGQQLLGHDQVSSRGNWMLVSLASVLFVFARPSRSLV